SGLQAFRQALDVTGQNISNVNTDGYVRQRADLVARESTPTGSSWVGNGVEVRRLERLVDDYLVDQSRGARSAASRLDVYAGQSARVAGLLGASSGGLSSALQQLDNAIQGVAADPSSLAARQGLVSTLYSTAGQLRGLDGRLRDLESEINGRIASEASAVDSIAKGLADLNRAMGAARASTGAAPNGLLDQRDKLLDQLAEKVAIRVVAAGDDKVNVFMGNGQALVLGENASKVALVRDPADALRQRLVLQKGGTTEDVTDSISGGTLGGLHDFRREVLDSSRNEVGRIAAVLSSVLNAQHAKGIDLLGTAGGDLLSVGGPQAVVPTDNGAVITASATLTDAEALTGVDYELSWSGAAWALSRLDSGAAVSFTGTGTAGSPIQFDGLSVVVGGAPAIGDRVLIQPTREAAGRMAAQVTAPARIAAAMPIRAAAATTNIGSAKPSGLEVLDASDPVLRTAVTVSFPSASTVSIDGGPPQAWAAGQAIDVNGWRLRLAGTPGAGDSFTVVDNGAGRGDNRNAALLSDALRSPLLDGGTTSLAEGATRLMSGLGAVTQQAQRNLEVQRLSYEDSIRQRQGISGVNLDEEAANLLRFQQAYQASAQVIRTANQVFDMLIDIVR
ncbi:MAG: flagellar hook-associated protein FlgK, partial [Gammaproteobacteria bacterium]|nr:flagellar hook-associated protein FlgK [Gammaproteobacteria bacterium]